MPVKCKVPNFQSKITGFAFSLFNANMHIRNQFTFEV